MNKDFPIRELPEDIETNLKERELNPKDYIFVDSPIAGPMQVLESTMVKNDEIGQNDRMFVVQLTVVVPFDPVSLEQGIVDENGMNTVMQKAIPMTPRVTFLIHKDCASESFKDEPSEKKGPQIII